MTSTLAAAFCLFCLAARLPVGVGLQDVFVSSCSDLSVLADAFQEDDVNATVVNNLSCDDEWTTVVVPSNRKLRVEAEKPTWRVKFANIRFVVEAREASDDWDCTFAINSKFLTTFDTDDGLGTQDVNGGVLNVGEGATVLFEGYTRCVGVSIISETNDGDYSDHLVYGGCWYNQGTIRVEDEAIFHDNDNSGGGESFPGDGGAVFNGASASIEFAGGIEAKRNICYDDYGGQGGAIYNEGSIVVSKSALFSSNKANGGGAIYNEENATFNFETEDTVKFWKNIQVDDNGGHVYNSGSMKFDSYVEMLRGDTIFTSGLMEFSGGALLKRISEGAIYASDGWDFGDTLPLITFENNEANSAGCEDLYYFSDGEFLCGP